MKSLESKQDYLERILMLKNRNGNVRSIDLVHDMSFSKPSISIAMKKLKEEGYIIIDKNGYIELTEEGYKIASSILEKHETISRLLISLGVDEEIALKDACKIEHDLSDETYKAIKQHANKNL